MPKLKLLGVHGLGDQRHSTWKEDWPKAIREVFPTPSGLELEFEFVEYDDIFKDVKLSAWEVAGAAAKLAASGVTSIFKRERGVLGDIPHSVRWTAGYVVAWVNDDSFKRKSRARVYQRIREFQPDVILAHSLGSLVTYNAFTHKDAAAPDLAPLLAQATYVTFGSQINNPFVVRNLTNGRVQEVPLAFWHHLYNKEDDVFTAPIRNWAAPNFRQTDTPFDLPGVGDHAAEGYFRHSNAIDNVWRPIGAQAMGARDFTGIAERTGASVVTARAPSRRRAEPKPRAPRRKALLVGINDYPDERNRLEGCVNDVFTMSSVLQECGFPPETIRACLDSRATAEGVLSRLEWLLDGAAAGDELVFYYSGHGAQIPEYGEDFEPDRNVEVLVPWDFDWTPEKAISDDQIHCLYSQLPYDTRLAMIFDCCHSGGIHRDGASRARGITPPDDIRHRQLKWDLKTRMWVPRDFRRQNRGFTGDRDLQTRYFGKDQVTERLGRAAMRRGLSTRELERLKADGQPDIPDGPYLPLIIEACGEEELSYEYRHGATSHGAFTYSLAAILRDKQKISFNELIRLTGSRLKDLRYDQQPKILGPTAIMAADVPWR
ncbi:caspase family protein [Phenylobacterium sp. LjRoot225]|uniref:caspase family protein n=1 Tax=Phenylobacterium sp. LjRoot225 TaxID=3342285 RepID=UPI003ED03402